MQLLESEGGCLARRSSGGGAVFHDLGNLNFTFVLPRGDYDLARQFAVLRRAVESFGIATEISGRNDLILSAGGAKFSGNAFRFTDKTALHHGTLLICADMEKLSRYLAPSKRKLAAKGIDSVRSRVCNLSDVCVGVTVAAMTEALTRAFIEVYGETAQIEESALDRAAVSALNARYASWDWRFGKTPQFTVSFADRFSWGEIEILLDCVHGAVAHCTVYSDAMDATLAAAVSDALENAPYTPEALKTRLFRIPSVSDEIKNDLIALLCAQSA